MKFNKCCIICFLCLSLKTSHAQNETSNWYFGTHAGISFNSGVPVGLTNGQLVTTEGCANISDSTGNLLFYTDGTTVWNRNHTMMTNGNYLGGGISSTHSAWIVPFVNNVNLYYIFTVGTWLFNNDLTYSVVDMTLNNGNGEVTVKNQLVLTEVTEKFAVIKHANNTDYWLVVQGYNTDSLYSYLLTAAGIAVTPVVSTLGDSLADTNCQGYLRFSPNGVKMAYVAMDSNYVKLFDFNTTNGSLSNKIHIDALPLNTTLTYGLEFSPNGQFLYASKIAGGSWLYQWDISSNSEPTINASRITLGNSATLRKGALQLGPDGKIYIAVNTSSYIAAINYPDLAGTACQFVDSAVYLPVGLCEYGLPNFIANTFTVSGIKSVVSNKTELQLLPNPASAYFEIKNYTFSNNDEISMIDIAGRKVLMKENNTSATTKRFNCENIGEGVYIITVKTKDKTFAQKLVVKH